MGEIMRAGVVGAGSIGLGFATAFADRGWAVTLAETDPDRRAAIPAEIARRHGALALCGRAQGAAAAAAARVTPVATAADAAAGAALVIEAGPERVEIKRALFADILAAAPGSTPVATASSAITVSDILPEREAQARCLVAHPANPPTVIAVLEIVGAPGTDPAALDAAEAAFRAAGFDPVRLGREAPGFVFNRLQGAMLREAYRLVAEGVIDVDGLDRLVRDGLGPRWSLSGPFETAELNTPGGIAAHAARMGPAYRAMGEARGERDCVWGPELVAEVERQRRAVLPAEALPARAAWREGAVARLIAARAALLRDG